MLWHDANKEFPKSEVSILIARKCKSRNNTWNYVGEGFFENCKISSYDTKIDAFYDEDCSWLIDRGYYTYDGEDGCPSEFIDTTALIWCYINDLYEETVPKEFKEMIYDTDYFHRIDKQGE